MAANELTPVQKKNARYYAAHHDEMLSRAKVYASKHPEEIREKNALYYSAHRAERIRAAKVYWAAHPEEKRANDARYHLKHGESISENHARKRHEPAYRVRLLICGAKIRARRSGMDFEESLRDLAKNVPTECPCCGSPLVYSGKHHMRAPSLDRVNNAKGYTVENVRIICYRCNTLKSDASVEEVKAILAYMSA